MLEIDQKSISIHISDFQSIQINFHPYFQKKYKIENICSAEINYFTPGFEKTDGGKILSTF